MVIVGAPASITERICVANWPARIALLVATIAAYTSTLVCAAPHASLPVGKAGALFRCHFVANSIGTSRPDGNITPTARVAGIGAAPLFVVRPRAADARRRGFSRHAVICIHIVTVAARIAGVRADGPHQHQR